MPCGVKFFPAFRSLIWIPLYIGAFLTGWGSFYTAPGALDKPSAARNKTSAKGRLPGRSSSTSAAWARPSRSSSRCCPRMSLVRQDGGCLQHVQGVGCARAGAGGGDGTGRAGCTNAVQATSAQAYDIFYTWTRSYYFVDISYVLWAFWALLFLFFYVPAGGTLVFLLFRQVRKQKAILVSYQRKIEVQLAHEEKNATVLTGDALTAPSAPRSAVVECVRRQLAVGAVQRSRTSTRTVARRAEARPQAIAASRHRSRAATRWWGSTRCCARSHRGCMAHSRRAQLAPRAGGELADEAHGESNLTAA